MTPSSLKAITPTRCGMFLLALAWLTPTTAPADTSFEFGIDQVDGDGWQARDIRVTVLLAPDGPIQAEVLVTEASLPEPVGLVKGIRGRCEAVVYRHAHDPLCTGGSHAR